MPTLSGGGAERVLINLANYFTNQSITIDLVVVSKTGAYINDISSKVNLINLNKNRVLFSLFSLINYFRENNPNAIITTMPHISLVVIVAKFFSGIDTNLVIRQPNYLSLNSGQKWWLNFYIKIVCYFFNKANKVIGISKGVCSDLRELRVKNCQAIYNPAVFPKIFNLAKKGINFSFDKKTFIAVGRLTKQKNFSLLIDAFYRVRKQLNCQLIILGEGELRADLKGQITKLALNNNVHLLGFVDNPYAYIKHSDVFVLSSLWEGFGNVIVEALALGTQVVATNCPSGPAEILENGKHGFLAEVNDKNDLSKQMLLALEKPIDKNVLIKRSKDFNIDKIARQYKKVLLGDTK